MTVSRAINENGYVSSGTRERIMRVIKELDYHPNGLARSLKRKRTHVIGILLPDIGHPFSAELARHLEETLLCRATRPSSPRRSAALRGSRPR